MPIVSARRYIAGVAQPEELAIDGNPSAPVPKGGFDWIGLTEPSADELALIQRQFGLHALAVEDAFNARQLPKVEVYGDQLFIIVRTAALHDDTITYGETAIFLTPRWIITVRHGSTRGHATLRRQLETTPSRLQEGVDHVLHAILDFITDGFFPIIEAIEEQVVAMEERAIDNFPDQATTRRIFKLRRELAKFMRIIAPMEEVAGKLAGVELPGIDPHYRPYFRDIYDHLRRVAYLAQGQRDTLASIVETSSLMEQHRTGIMTRQLAAWATIFAVPTAIAGIYGMNFDFMPELRWRYGYFAILGVIAVICGGLWLRFRRLGWL